METMRDFLDQIRKRYNVKGKDVFSADMAEKIGISAQALHQHKTIRTKHFSEHTAYNIASLLNLNPAYVLVCLRVESADNRATKMVWMGMLEKVERYAAAVILGVIFTLAPLPAKADCFLHNVDNLYIIRNWTRGRLRSWLYGLLRRLYGGFQACLEGNIVPTTNNKK